MLHFTDMHVKPWTGESRKMWISESKHFETIKSSEMAIVSSLSDVYLADLRMKTCRLHVFKIFTWGGMEYPKLNSCSPLLAHLWHYMVQSGNRLLTWAHFVTKRYVISNLIHGHLSELWAKVHFSIITIWKFAISHDSFHLQVHA